MNKDDQWDVIIIGSGISAMAAAWALANHGKKILLCERHKKGGGMAHEFSRSGKHGRYFFSAGVHYLGQVAPGAFTWQLFQRLTGGQLRWKYLPDYYDLFHFPGFTAQAHQDLHIFANELSAQFPNEKAAIQRYFRDQPLAALGVGLFQLTKGLPRYWRSCLQWLLKRIFAVGFQTTQEYLEKNFHDPRLRAILCAQWGDYGTPPVVSLFGYSAIVTQHYQQGIGHPLGGSGQIFALIAPRLQACGVEIRLHCNVEQIIVEKHQAIGISYRQGQDAPLQQAFGKKILSTVGIFNTYSRLLPHQILPASFHQELTKLTPAPSAVILYLGMRPSWSKVSSGLTGANHWFFPQLDHPAAFQHTRAGEGILFFAMTDGNNENERLPTAQVIAFLGPEGRKEFTPWEPDPAGRKTDPRYQQLKQEISERILIRLSAHCPNLREAIDFQELATPFTFDKYQNAHHGAFYGIIGDWAKLHSPLTTPRSFVKNLYLGGQDLLSPGIVGALMGGLQAAGKILGPLGLVRIFRGLFNP